MTTIEGLRGISEKLLNELCSASSQSHTKSLNKLYFTIFHLFYGIIGRLIPFSRMKGACDLHSFGVSNPLEQLRNSNISQGHRWVKDNTTKYNGFTKY